MRYYFHLVGAAEVPDVDGHDFATLDQARLEAVRSSGEFLRDAPEAILQGQELRIELRDDDGLLRFTVTASGRDG